MPRYLAGQFLFLEASVMTRLVLFLILKLVLTQRLQGSSMPDKLRGYTC